jgi:hypothetical protein
MVTKFNQTTMDAQMTISDQGRSGFRPDHHIRPESYGEHLEWITEGFPVSSGKNRPKSPDAGKLPSTETLDYFMAISG